MAKPSAERLLSPLTPAVTLWHVAPRFRLMAGSAGWLSERIKVNDKLYFSFVPTRFRVSELTSEEILEKINKTNQSI